jgi:voltage-gated potassium channel
VVATPKLIRDPSERAKALERYESVAELPLLILALAMLPLIVLPLSIELDPSVEDAFFAIDWVIWAAFAADLTFRTYLSERRGHYLATHWYDVIIVVVPFLRPLRVVRSVRILRLIRLSRAVGFAARTFTSARELLAHRGVGYVLAITGFIVFASAALIFAVEHDQNPALDDYGSAIWWAMATVTTVGYGDTVPITPEGRAVAIFLMIVGISVFGFLTATIAAFLVEHTRREARSTTDDVMRKLDSLESEVQHLRGELSRQRDGPVRPRSGPPL